MSKNNNSRIKLLQIGSVERHTFTGIVVREGIKRGYKSDLPTLLLTDVKLLGDDEVLTDHLWFNLTTGFKNAWLQEGNVVQFDARVEVYQKGYQGRREDVYKKLEIDYKLSRPSKVKKL